MASTSNGSFLDNARNSRINIKDVKAMYLAKIRPNERMMVAEVMALNNEMVNRWYNEVLVKLCDEKGELTVSKAEAYWKVYMEGYRTIEYQKIKKHTHSVPTEVADYWVNFLQQPIKELYAYGTRVLLQAYDIIVEYYRMWVSDRLYELLFNTNDPLEWMVRYDNSPEAQKILCADLKPYDIIALSEKCQVLINVQASPSN